MPGIAYTLGLDPGPGIRGIEAFKGAMGGLSSAIGMIGPLAGLAGGLGLVGAAAAGFKKSIDEAAKMEGFEAGFKPFLGSLGEAKQRMEELAKEAMKMPFQLPDVVEASHNLQIFTGDALSTGKGLAMVGNVASAMGGNLAQTAEQIGRAYQLLTTGVGEPRVIRELEEMGAISGVTAGKLDKLVESGQHGMPIWNIALGDLSRFSTAMSDQMGTWNGMMTNFKDAVDEVFREFGAPILDQIKPILSDAISYTDGLADKAHKWGMEVAWGIGLLRNLEQAGKLSEFAGLSLKVGFADAVAFLTEKMASLFATFSGGNNLFAGLGEVIEGFSLELTSAITTGITNALSGISIFGHPLMSAQAVDLNNYNANEENQMGQLKVRTGTTHLGQVGGLAAKFGELLKGMTTNTDQARKEQTEMMAKYGPAIKDALKNLDAPKVTKPDLASVSFAAIAKEDRIKPLTDRLAQIGLFIGGNGGPQGQRAAQDTASNTRKMVEQIDKLIEKISPRPVGAVF